MRRLHRIVLGSILLALAGIAVYSTRSEPAPPVDFADDLRGPASPNLTIPFHAYALTPEGLLRTDSATDRVYGNDRPMVKTVSAAYLSRDFVFEVDVTIPAETHDVAFVGFGLGDPNPAFNMEPAGAFMFRIHNLPGVDTVHAAAALPPSERPSDAGPAVHGRLEVIGTYVSDTTTTFRIERADNRVMLSMPATKDASHTFELGAFPSVVDRKRAYLFFGNSAEGTIFSNVRVRPRG